MSCSSIVSFDMAGKVGVLGEGGIHIAVAHESGDQNVCDVVVKILFSLFS